MKYIDAEKLKEKVDEIRQYWLADSTGLEVGEYGAELYGAEHVLDSIDDIIDSLQQEQSEVDLEKEVEKFAKECGYPSAATIDFQFARHFYELGLKARKA